MSAPKLRRIGRLSLHFVREVFLLCIGGEFAEQVCLCSALGIRRGLMRCRSPYAAYYFELERLGEAVLRVRCTMGRVQSFRWLCCVRSAFLLSRHCSSFSL
jgi:hypothetical protein